jgi:hypothetical protein
MTIRQLTKGEKIASFQEREENYCAIFEVRIAAKMVQ